MNTGNRPPPRRAEPARLISAARGCQYSFDPPCTTEGARRCLMPHTLFEHVPTLGISKMPPIINADRPTTADLLGLT